jgi:hypothetical protein
MVIINRAATSSLDLTLTENVTITNPYYLFVFTNKTTNKVSMCFLSDSSLYPERYNRFNLTEPTNVTLISGDYIYQVYEKSVVTLVIPSDDYLLETGIARVPVIALTETEFESTLNVAPIVYEATD